MLSVVAVFKIVGGEKTSCAVSFHFVVNNIFEKPFDYWLVNHLKKCGLEQSQCGFRSSRSKEDLLASMADRIGRPFIMPSATSAALRISKNSYLVRSTGHPFKLKFTAINDSPKLHSWTKFFCPT